MAPKTKSFHLDSALKQYTYDQDKSLDPKMTYKKAFQALEKTFPEKEISLKVINAKDFNIYDFGDGSLMSHGKGATQEQSKASAIMEFLERMSWLHFDYKNAPGYQKTSFNNLNQNHQYDNLEKTFYIAHSRKKEDVASLIKNIPLDWIQAYSLTNNKETYYPLNWNNCYQTTNGLAAGNTKEEAIVQGICEVAERHNVDYFLQNIDKEPLRLVDIDSLDSDVCLELITNIQKNNIKLYLIDATLDLNISTIIACGIDQNPIHQALRIVYGYGCHTDPQKAIIRAITEYLQGREGVLQTLPGAVSEDFSYKGNWQFILSIDIEKYISQAKMISCHDLPDLSDNDLKNEALCLIDLFNKKGFEIIIADKTHPKIKIPVYRIFVPGLLPGTNFCTISQNDDLLVCQLYAQGGQGKKAKRYYEDHFNNIINNLNPMWHLLKEFRPDIDIMAKNLSPQSLPIESLVLHEDYLENNMASVYKNSLGAIIEKLKTTLE